MATNAKNIAELLNTDTTVKVGDIEDGSVTTVKLAASAVTTAKVADNAITSAKALNLGRRNIIVNGAMRLAQRGTSNTGVGYKTVDRFAVNQTGFDQLVSTKTQEADGPDGFDRSLKIATTTIENSLDADEYGNMSHAIEGKNLQNLAYGTSSAKSFTLSFYVKSNLTGNFSVTAYKGTGGSAKQQDRRYTINSANTWERKTLTFLGDTATAITNDTAAQMYLYWHTAFGSNFGTDTYNGSAGWSAYSNAGWGAGQDVNTLYNNTSNYIQFTGIQMELGDTATDFEHILIGEEHMLCRRYYQINYTSWYGVAAAAGYFVSDTISYVPPMRGNPSVAQTSFVSGSGGRFTVTGATSSTIQGTTIYSSPASAGGNSGYNATWSADAEI